METRAKEGTFRRPTAPIYFLKTTKGQTRKNAMNANLRRFWTIFVPRCLDLKVFFIN